MTNEIKEILDIFYNEYPKEEKQLEDYITNLQEENKEYQDKYENLLILGLKEETHFNIKCEDLQQRIDKAKNYILENICCDTRIYTKSENVYKVVDILRGDE